MPSKNVLRRQKIRYKIRKKISGTAERPRLSVFRSNKGISAQLIDDVNAVTLVSVNSKAVKAETKIATATEVGKAIAEKAKAANISTCLFDRSGYLYHGRVKALAEGAREGGLNF